MKKHLSILLVLVLVLSTMPLTFGEATDVVDLTILGTSDLHGRIYPYEYATDSVDKDAGLAKVSTVVNEIRSEHPNTILFDCGDTLQDNSAELFNDLPVHPMIQAMNMIGYDAWVVGNHEFNFNLDFLKKNIKGFNGTTLAANIYKTDTGERFVEPYKIFDVKGVKVAIVGMMPPNVPIWEASTPDHFKGLEFTDVLEETGKVLKEIEGQYDVLIGAYHIGPEGEHGYDGIEKVAETYPEFDVIYGGHAHSKYTNEINGVQLIEPGRYGWAVAKSDISLEKKNGKWEITSLNVANVETQDAQPDQKILDAFKFVDDQSLEEANKVVGDITADFIESPDYYTGADEVTTLPTAQIKDTAVIDLINEVQMFYSDADVSSAALFNFGSNLKKGVFKKKDVAFIYKYDNTLMGVNITGENLLKYMEWSANYFNQMGKGDLTISFNPEVRGYNYDMFSGINYDINISKPSGERIENVTIDGKAIDKDHVYKLAVNNYRFGTLISLGLVTMEDKYFDSYTTYQDQGRVRDLIIKYTQEEKNGVLNPTVDNNWKITGTDVEPSYDLYQPIIKKMIKEGTIALPKSEDGRTPNVKSIQLNDLVKAGYTANPMSETYKVKAGDVLWKIAEKYGVTWQALQEMNHLNNPNMIFPSQELLIPVQ